MVHDKKERMVRCMCCNNMVFPKICPAVIIGVTDGDRILLTKYAGRTYKNYALVAGGGSLYVEYFELKNQS